MSNTNSYTLIKVVSGVVVFLLLASLALYCIVFDGGLSTKNGDWGNFGDFIGGISMLLLTGLNVLIFYQLTKQVEQRNDTHAATQLKITATKAKIKTQQMIANRVRELNSPLYCETAMATALKCLKDVYFYLNWASLGPIFSDDIELRRINICSQIRPIIGINDIGESVQPTKQDDDDAWDKLRNSLTVFEVLLNKDIMNTINMITELSKTQT